MSLIPNDINDLIIDGDDIVSLPRPYMGYSTSGEPCARKLWYDLHWVYKRRIGARLQRIFNVGHNTEDQMIEHLASNSIKVWGEQDEVVGHGSHILGHIDGLCNGIPNNEEEVHLLELKTMNDRAFKDVIKNGVKKSKPGYYAQMTSYMGKLGLKNGLFMSYNKNDSSYYYELIEFDSEHFKYLEARLFDILVSEFPLDKIGPKTWFECKWCDAKDVCHNGAKPEVNCRTCQQCTIEDKGKWSCGTDDKDLDLDAQIKGCKFWQELESLNEENRNE